MKKKIKWQIIIPIIIALILVGVAFYIDYSKKEGKPAPSPESKPGIRLKPISPSENPKRAEEVKNLNLYGCGGPATIKPETIKEPDKIWKINKSKKVSKISLGKYRINNPAITVLEIPKIWLYFFSDALGREEDKMYGLEESYTSGITLIVNGQERELGLGGNSYMFIELDNYPFGDLYPYDQKYSIDFEFIIEFQCKNFEKSACLNNIGEPLDYINSADISSQIRIFALGCQEFTYDMSIDANFEY